MLLNVGRVLQFCAAKQTCMLDEPKCLLPQQCEFPRIAGIRQVHGRPRKVTAWGATQKHASVCNTLEVLPTWLHCTSQLKGRSAMSRASWLGLCHIEAE